MDVVVDQCWDEKMELQVDQGRQPQIPMDPSGRL